MKNCDLGCSHFTCGSIGHIKSCPNYEESMQQMIDNKNRRIELLEKELKKQILKNVEKTNVADKIFKDKKIEILLKSKN